MKRGLSSFDIYVIVAELQELRGSYIDKIYQLNRDELLIRVNNRKTGQKEIIFVRNGELLCTTQKKFVVPEKPSMFAMTLRKYLLNGRISQITQHEFDRIIRMKVKKKAGDFILIFELFANGNIILLNTEGKIILPLIKQRWAHRTLQPHEVYVPPPSQINPFHLNKEKFMDLMKKSKKDLVRTLAVYVNLGGTYAEEICFRAGIDKNTGIQELREESFKKIYVELQKLLDIFKEKKFQPTFVKKEGKTTDILPLPFKSYTESEFVKTGSFSRGLQEFVDVRKTKEKSTYQKKLQKLQRQLLQQRKTIEDFKKKITQKKIEGDTIYLNFQSCQELLHDIVLILEKKEKKEEIEQINKRNIVKNFDPTSNELIVLLQDDQGKTREIELDFRKTVSENAENAYRASKKFQEKLKGAEVAVKNTKNEIKVYEKKVILKKEEREIKKEKQFWFERFRWFISIEGNIVVAGRDAKSNEQVVKKYLKEGDRYVHADIHGAPSCVVKGMDINDKKIPISERTLEEACRFAASYSKAWKQFSEAHVYWVLPEQVSKTPQSGEFLPKGAFVVRGKRNYFKCKLEVAVGEALINDLKKLMGGPLESVKAMSDKYVVLKPGVTKKSVVARKLSNVFHTSAQAIERALPPGDVNIVKAIGFGIK
ncbi:MAG: NFACT family protein [Thermoplasmatales archaeon]|nr:MAG: NFACT family protein [Thermoplasmatales archaeon]